MEKWLNTNKPAIFFLIVASILNGGFKVIPDGVYVIMPENLEIKMEQAAGDQYLNPSNIEEYARVYRKAFEKELKNRNIQPLDTLPAKPNEKHHYYHAVIQPVLLTESVHPTPLEEENGNITKLYLHKITISGNIEIQDNLKCKVLNSWEVEQYQSERVDKKPVTPAMEKGQAQTCSPFFKKTLEPDAVKQLVEKQAGRSAKKMFRYIRRKVGVKYQPEPE